MIHKNVEAEHSLLQAMESGQRLFKVDADDFYDSRNGLMFQAMAKLITAGKKANVVTIPEQLKKMGLLAQAGGAAYVVHVLQNATGFEDGEMYAGIVKTYSQNRKLLTQARTVLEVGEDPTQSENLIQEHFAAVQKILSGTTSETDSIADNIDRIYADAMEALRHPPDYLGISTGLRFLDDEIDGLLPGDLVIIAGRISHGKTSLALTMGLNAAKEGKRVLIFSMEMAADALWWRLLGMESRMSVKRLRRGNYTKDEALLVQTAKDKLRLLDIIVDGGDSQTEVTVQASVSKNKPDLVIVDGLQAMKPATGRNEGRNLQLGAIAAGLKAMAKREQIPCLAMAQLNRNAISGSPDVDLEPALGMMKDSDDIAAQSDITILIHRLRTGPGHVNLIVAKSRNGPKTRVPAKFIEQCCIFMDRAG